MPFQFKHEKFEGPLEVLLNMIEERKLSVSEISLSQIADQYFSYIRSLENFPKIEVANFLVVAATLMLIKSRSLIPTLDLSDEEEESIQDLEHRLNLLKTFRILSKNIDRLASNRNFMYSRHYLAGFSSGFYPPEKFKIKDVIRSMHQVLDKIPKIESLPEKVILKAISIEERMMDLVSRITADHSGYFHKITKGNKEDLIISFLAVLELLKQGLVLVNQKNIFGDIEITSLPKSPEASELIK
ncbi:MAG: hypothetical protein COU46_00100 [Candidatus Niyogibacteria bacterium CG10_big_fil_rev_8_21_14_0_10_42_19]|uniref:Segregation and condensation protein A n=1 Tax=Candidatus Niyogibacteria bacterium CG10_big_fil_rev_8_21_14_0_10_42_19 TaxID=1974725 RepID=A0A2H0TGL0_9BACT|nr:MAG: hypothetical protein COU46_00100 [Candidatus Niyogibacteria bacterium CG10_big_fil_rev_8_21_14_0_10_42_19]